MDGVLIDADLVRRLLAAQFPHWAELPLSPVPLSGMDNATFRLGDDLSVRLPRYAHQAGQVEREPRLAPHLRPPQFGTLAVGDPAVDLLPAWKFLPAQACDVFRAALGPDDATWARGRGWALAGFLPVPHDPFFREDRLG